MLLMRKLEVSDALTPLPSTESPDSRNHIRYQAKDGALVSPVASVRKYWKMLDISSVGMSFRCLPSEDLKGFSKIDIVTQDLEFALEGIPFELTSDCEFESASTSFPNIRRCGVEFRSLTPAQESSLADFIRRYTVPPKTGHADQVVRKKS
jgi:hypothetical protein